VSRALMTIYAHVNRGLLPAFGVMNRATLLAP
jgi:hypothetical protein